jgi:hypothetical protein
MRGAMTIAAVAALLAAPGHALGEETLFKDDFKKGLSDKWKADGLKKEDYRVRDGGLEVRVQPGKFGARTPSLKVVLPFTSADTVVATVKVTLLDEFTRDGEFAGVYLFDQDGPEFGARKERFGGKLVFSPGQYKFIGRAGEEGDPDKYEVRYTHATKEAGALRIVVDRGNAFFQVGPDANDDYATYFHSAIRKNERERGFCLAAAGASDGAAHWVRFEDFRAFRR